MTCAVKVCESALREDFGFEHIVWIYSGRRGVHCWVCDETARELTNDARLAIIKYFSVVSGMKIKRRRRSYQVRCIRRWNASVSVARTVVRGARHRRERSRFISFI